MTGMFTSQQTRVQVQDTIDTFALYFGRKDITLVLSLIDPEFTGFGKGTVERASCIDEYRHFLTRYLEQWDTVSMEFSDLLIRCEGTVAWVAANCLITTGVKGKNFTLATRCSIVLRGTGHGWLISHLHISVPDSDRK